jgi:hypothetical protein
MSSDPEAIALVLGPKRVAEIGRRDNVFARHLDVVRRDFIHLLRRAPAYIAIVRDQMQPQDLYRARIPREILEGLQRGDYEKALKNRSGHAGSWRRSPFPLPGRRGGTRRAREEPEVSA